MLTLVAAFVDGTIPDLVADGVGLAIAVCTFAGLIWAAVTRATKPLRDRLDEVRDLATIITKESRRVDDLGEQMQNLERRLDAFERRLEDVYALIVTLIGPQASTRRAARKKGNGNEQ